MFLKITYEIVILWFFTVLVPLHLCLYTLGPIFTITMEMG